MRPADRQMAIPDLYDNTYDKTKIFKTQYCFLPAINIFKPTYPVQFNFSSKIDSLF